MFCPKMRCFLFCFFFASTQYVLKCVCLHIHLCYYQGSSCTESYWKRSLKQILHAKSAPIRNQIHGVKASLSNSTCLFFSCGVEFLNVCVRARSRPQGWKNYWHMKGMFIHGGDESADVSVICDDNLIELLAYWGDKKKKGKEKILYWFKHRLWGHRLGMGAPIASEVSSFPPDELWKLAALQIYQKHKFDSPQAL